MSADNPALPILALQDLADQLSGASKDEDLPHHVRFAVGALLREVNQEIARLAPDIDEETST